MTASYGNGQKLYPSRTRDRHARAKKDYRGNGLALGPEKLRTDAQWITHVTTEEERAGQTYPKSVPSGRGDFTKAYSTCMSATVSTLLACDHTSCCSQTCASHEAMRHNTLLTTLQASDPGLKEAYLTSFHFWAVITAIAALDKASAKIVQRLRG